MAKQLVSAMTAEFDPSQYKDEYRQALEEVIMAKVEGKETVEIEAPEEGGKLIDLMAALEASVNAAKAARDGEKPVSVSEPRRPRRRRRARRPPRRSEARPRPTKKSRGAREARRRRKTA
jgi:DNA end-binding protein Ku